MVSAYTECRSPRVTAAPGGQPVPHNGPQASTQRSPFVSQEDEEKQAELRVTRGAPYSSAVGPSSAAPRAPATGHLGTTWGGFTGAQTGPPGPPRGRTGRAGQKIGTGQFQENWGPQGPCTVPGIEGVTRGPFSGRQRYELRKGPEPTHSGGTRETDAVRCLAGADGSSEAIGSLE